MTVVLQDDAALPSEVPLSIGPVDGVPLHDVKAEIGRPYVEILNVEQRDGSSSSWLVCIPSVLANNRDKGVAEEDYEMGSDLDTDEVRMMSGGLAEWKYGGKDPCEPLLSPWIGTYWRTWRTWFIP